MLSACGGKVARHSVAREKAILSHAAQDRFPIVMVGDSFVELADVPSLCGKRVLNAGVSGAKAADVERFAPQVIASERPELVIINVGVNDANRRTIGQVDDVRRSLLVVLEQARRVGARTILLGIAPVSGKGLSEDVDAAHAQRLDVMIRGLGGRAVPALDTMDGLHPSAAGYQTWKAAIAPDCSS